MIRVDRGAEPDGFATRSANWQNRFAQYINVLRRSTYTKAQTHAQ